MRAWLFGSLILFSTCPSWARVMIVNPNKLEVRCEGTMGSILSVYHNNTMLNQSNYFWGCADRATAAQSAINQGIAENRVVEINTDGGDSVFSVTDKPINLEDVPTSQMSCAFEAPLTLDSAVKSGDCKTPLYLGTVHCTDDLGIDLKMAVVCPSATMTAMECFTGASSGAAGIRNQAPTQQEKAQ